jgi:hypothetical protein
MPVLAIPYLVPFAEAAGIAIGVVASAAGLMELSNRVQAYMEANPEETLKILTLLAPAQGIMALFNKEAGDDEVTEEIEVKEEIKPKSKKSKKEIILEELAKEKGSYASPEAEGSWASPRGRIIRRLKEEGKITDKPDPHYDPDKKYKGYKRFIRGRTGRKADGGIMDVL